MYTSSISCTTPLTATLSRWMVLGVLLFASGFAEAFAQGSAQSLPPHTVVHRGIYRVADQQWMPTGQSTLKNAAIVFDNTNGTGGFLPSANLPDVDPPWQVVDWATTIISSVVNRITFSYATSAPGPIRITLKVYTGMTDTDNGVEVVSIDCTNLPGSGSGNNEVFIAEVDTRSFLAQGAFGIGAVLYDQLTGLLTATGGTGITDFYRVYPELTNRTIDGFVAQFYYRVEGEERTVLVVDNTAPPGGNGTFVTPFSSLAEAEAASAPGDVIYLRTGNGAYEGPFTVKSDQKFIGEGVPFGTIPVNTAPVLNVSDGPVVVLNDGDDDTLLAGILIEGIDDEAITVNGSGEGTLDIHDVEIVGGSVGIDVITLQSSLVLKDVTYTNQSEAALRVDGGSGDITVTGESRIDQNTEGLVLLVSGNHDGTITFEEDTQISATGGDGLLFDNADGQYTFEGDVTLNSSNEGVALKSSNGRFLFDTPTLNDATLRVEGGAADLTFTNLLLTGRTGMTFTDGHTGTAYFDEGSMINALPSEGLQFDNANGTYTFDGDVTLTGGDAGIDIIGGSGVYDFNGQTTITGVDTAIKVTDALKPSFDVSSAHISLAATAFIVTDSEVNANVTTLEIIDVANSAIELNNVQGEFRVDDFKVDKAGGDGFRGDRLNAIVTLSQSIIENTTGAGVRLTGSTGTLNLGDLLFDSDSGNDCLVFLAGGPTTTITFDTLTCRGGGVEFENTNGLDFQSKGVSVSDAFFGISTQSVSGSTFNFGGTKISNTSDKGIDIRSTNTATFTFDGLDVSVTGGAGLSLNDLDDITIEGGETTIHRTSDAGIDIRNSTNTAFTADNLKVTNPGGDGFRGENLSGTLTLGKVDIELEREGDDCFKLLSVDRTKLLIDELKCAGGGIDFEDIKELDAEIDALFGVDSFFDFSVQNAEGSTFNLGETTIDGTGSAGSGIFSLKRNLGVNFRFGQVDVNYSGDRDVIRVEDSGHVTFDQLNINGGQNGLYVKDNRGEVIVNGGTIENTTETGAKFENVNKVMIDQTRVSGIKATEYILIELQDVVITGVQEEPGISVTPGGGNNAAPAYRGKTAADPLGSPAILLDNVTSDAAVVIETGGSETVDVSVTNSTITTTGADGLTVQTRDASTALVTLTGNDVNAATNDFVLSQLDASTLLLAGFEGGDAAAFIQASNEGMPSVVVNGNVGAGPSSDTADLRLIDKAVSETRPMAGDTLTYTIRTTNAGPATASAVTISDPLPAGLTYVPGTLTVNGQERTDAADGDDADFDGTAANTVTVTAGIFAVGDTLVITFQARVADTADGMTITNTATVAGATPDVLEGNNVARVDIGVGVVTAVEEHPEAEAALVPEAFTLHQNYRNPFNSETTIRFSMPEASQVKLVVYDVLGRQVRVLVDGTRQAGMHEVVFEASGLPSGTYLYRLETPQGSFAGSMLLVK